MIGTLETPEVLAARSRWSLIAAAAFASAVLCPLVDELVLGGLSHGLAMRMEELLYGLWGSAVGALLGGLAMRTALRPGRGPFWAIGTAALGGIAYPLCLLSLPALLALPGAGPDELLRALVIGPLAVTFFGAIASLPAGLAFGVIFFLGSLHARSWIDQPSHEQVASSRVSAAVLLAAASIAALLLAATLEGAYCQAIFNALLPALEIVPPEGTDIAWTRLVVFPAPLAFGAAGLLVRGWLEQRRIVRLARDLAAGVHPTLVLDETLAEGETEILPLRETDAATPRRRHVRRRDDGSPFREAGRAVCFVAAEP